MMTLYFQCIPYRTIRALSVIMLFAIGAGTLFQTNAIAHPHVWVTAETDIEFDAKKEITGFRHKWIFDEYYTQFAIAGLDTNGDGAYSREELQPLAQTNVEALAEFGYFTFSAVGGSKLGLKTPVNYYLEHTNNLLTLYFTLPLEKAVPEKDLKAFSFQIYDPGYYVALTFGKKSPVRVASVQPLDCNPVIRTAQTQIKQATFSQTLGENIDPSSNIGSSFADKVEFDCKG